MRALANDVARSTLEHHPRLFSRIFWYAVLESIGIVGMAMFVVISIFSVYGTHILDIVFKSTSSKRSSRKRAGGTKYNIRSLRVV